MEEMRRDIWDSKHKISAGPILGRYANSSVYKTRFFIVFYELTVEYVIQVGHNRIMKRTRCD